MNRRNIIEKYLELRRELDVKQAIERLVEEVGDLPDDLRESDVAGIARTKANKILAAPPSERAALCDRASFVKILKKIIESNPRGAGRRSDGTKKVVLSVSLSVGLFEAIDKAARREGVTRAKFCRKILASGVKYSEK